MRNVTITLDEEVARWARIRAAEEDTSVSRFVGDLLRQRMRHQREYDKAMKDYFSRGPVSLGDGKPYPRREDLYDRQSLRRH